MSRKLYERHAPRSSWSTVAGFASLAALAACSSGAGTTSTTDTTEQALTEAQGSFADAKAAADACFAAFDTCKSAAGADVEACKTTLRSCLPAEAGPGPHCGGRGGHHGPPGGPGGGGPGGDCDGGPPPGADGQPPPPPGADGQPPPPPPDGGAPIGPPPGGPDGDHDGPGGGEGKGHPGFCNKVPLPKSPEMQACKDTLDACLAAGTDDKTCFDAHHACVKAAFDAAFQALCANKDAICADASTPADACERLTTRCAAGVAPAVN